MIFKRIAFLRKYLLYLFLVLGCLFVGAIFFLIQRNWLIIQWTLGGENQDDVIIQSRQDIALRKKVDLFYFKEDKFASEESTFVWFSNKSENIKHLISNWLLFLHAERILCKKVCLESVALSQDDQQAFFSFDQLPLDREWSILKKWHFIESMFKTIRGAAIDIKSVVFLVGHQPMEDDHLDFSQSWPIEGFLDDVDIF